MKRIILIFAALLSVSCSKEGSFEDAEFYFRQRQNAEAIAIYEPLEKAGDSRAALRLASIYHSQGTEGLNKSLHYYVRAAELGDIDGMYLAGISYLHGKGSDENETQGLKYLTKAAGAGSSAAMIALGDHYQKQAKVRNMDQQTTITSWYEKAYERGNSLAALKLYSFYVGKPPHKIESAAWHAAHNFTRHPDKPSDPYKFLTEEETRLARIEALHLFNLFNSNPSPETFLNLSKL